MTMVPNRVPFVTFRGASGFFIFTQIFVNAVPLLAIICFRQRLSRLNSVYIYVKNTLLCNIVFGVFVAYTMLNFALVFERPTRDGSENPNRYDEENPAHRSIMMWWTFRKSFTLCMLFVMENSVIGLTYGLKQRTFLTTFSHSSRVSGRSMSMSFHNIFGSLANIGTQNTPPKTLFRRSQAYIIVGASWLLPAACSLLSTFSWNCLDVCNCLPATYHELQCTVPKTDSEMYRCSQEWLPMSGSFLVLFLGIWIVQSTILIFMLVRSIRSYQWSSQFARHHIAFKNVTIPNRPMIPRDMTLHHAAIRQGRTQSFRPLESDFGEDVIDRPRLSTIFEEPVSTTDTSLPVASEIETNRRSETLSTTTDLPEDLAQPGQRPSSLSPSLKLVIVLSASVTLSTLPFAIVALCDLVMPDDQFLNPVIIYLSYAAVFVHVFSCPLFLVKYLSDLKQATNRLLLRFTKS